MDLAFNTKIKRSKVFRELHSKNIIPQSDIHAQYPHVTFHVDSLLEYLKIVKLMKSIHYTDETLVFRGIPKSDWLAVPGLGRIISVDETIEHCMINEFMTLRPEAFQGLYSSFEILAKMQHYGLPTRLLDFTTNPLVALFFACADNHHDDARVLCSSTFLTDSLDKTVEAICSSYKCNGLVNCRVEDLLTNIDITPFKYLLRLYLQRDFRPLFVKPWYWNQRIVNQAAIFLVFPNTLFDRLGKIAYYRDYTELDG